MCSDRGRRCVCRPGRLVRIAPQTDVKRGGHPIVSLDGCIDAVKAKEVAKLVGDDGQQVHMAERRAAGLRVQFLACRSSSESVR